MPTSQRPAKSPEPSRPGVRRRRSQDKNTPEPPATAVTPVVQLAPLTVEETPTALSPSVPSPAACEGSVLRQREPLYLAVRLWGVNSLDQKTQWAECVFRVFLIFRPRGEALRVFPQPGEPRITSNDPGWTDELVESLPTLALMNGKETTDEKAKREFFRVDDAKQIVDGEERDLWFPETGGRNVGLVTYQIEANVQLDLQATPRRRTHLLAPSPCTARPRSLRHADPPAPTRRLTLAALHAPRATLRGSSTSSRTTATSC